MKKKKMSLKALNVKSFVTSAAQENSRTIKGGGPQVSNPVCLTPPVSGYKFCNYSDQGMICPTPPVTVYLCPTSSAKTYCKE